MPDDKNWTWVLERTCPDCLFDTAQLPAAAVPELLRENAAIWQGLLGLMLKEDNPRYPNGERSDGAQFTVESFARYFIHDPIHHVHDVNQGYRRLAARAEG